MILVPFTVGILWLGLTMRVPVAIRGDNDLAPYFTAAVQLAASVVVSLGIWAAYFGDILLVH
jgi:hypothetical protein